jgi:predicted DNA-binding transcriptional regulator YafY
LFLARILVAWCETRSAFRHFRTDRIAAISELDERYPRRRLALLKEWRQTQIDRTGCLDDAHRDSG